MRALAPAPRAAPSLAGLMDSISELAERPVHVTGSGAGLYVLCDESIHADALAIAIRTRLALPAVAVKTCIPPPPEPA